MNVPALVASALGDEDVAAHVPLKGEDALFVTPTRTIRYQADGLLSDESVEEFPHEAERVEISEGRRKSKITLDYGLEGRESFTVPGNRLDDALHPVLAGVLNAADVTGPGETVKRTYRFSELTLVVTSDRVVKHIGGAVWDPEYEEIAFDAVTGIDTEEGNVASQLVLETSGRTQRIKAPNEQFRDVRETIENALFAYHDVGSRSEFEQVVSPEEDAPQETVTENVTFDSGVDPIEANLPDAEPGEEARQKSQPAQSSGSVDQTGQAAQTTQATQPGQQAQTEQSERPSQTSQTSEQTTQQSSEAESNRDSQADDLAAGGFEAATTKVEPEIDPAVIAEELDEMQAALDAQREALDEQQAQLDALRELILDQ